MIYDFEKEINYSEIGMRIRNKRKSLKMSQERLAEKAGIGSSHVSHIETGNTKVSMKVFINIVNALDATADEILCDYIDKAVGVLESEISEELKDCTEKELRFIMDMVKYIKYSLRKRRVL